MTKVPWKKIIFDYKIWLLYVRSLSLLDAPAPSMPPSLLTLTTLSKGRSSSSVPTCRPDH
jgi:hypothetical protein